MEVGKHFPSRNVLVTAITHSDWFDNSDARKRQRFRRAGAAKDTTTVPAVVLAIGEGKGSAAAHANFGIGPVRRLGRVSYGQILSKYKLTAEESTKVEEIFGGGGKSKPSAFSVL